MTLCRKLLTAGSGELAKYVGLWRGIWLRTTAPQLLVGAVWHDAAVYPPDPIRQKLVCTQVWDIVFYKKTGYECLKKHSHPA